MKKVIIDCNYRIKKWIVPLFQIGVPNVQLMGVTIAEEKQMAVDFITDTVKNNPNEITIVALSTLTNIAAAIDKDADAMGGIKELIIVGGSQKVQGDYSAVAEQNFGRDPEAAEKVFKNDSIKKVMAGLDATESIVVPSFIKKVFLALGILTDDTVIQDKEAYVEIETEGIAAGQSVCDDAGQFHQGETNARIVSEVDNEKLFSIII